MIDDNRRWAWLNDYPFEDLAAAFGAALGKTLQLARENRGLTRPEVVRVVARPMSEQTLINYERGDRPPELERVLELCIVYRRPIEDLFVETLKRAHYMLVHEPRPARAATRDTGADAAPRARGYPGRRSVPTTAELRDRVAQLLLENNQLRTRAERDGKRAAAAEESVTNLRAVLAGIETKHNEEMAALRAAQKRELRDVRLEVRRELSAVRAHPAPVALPEPVPTARRWQDDARALTIAEDAEEFHVTVYRMLTPLRQMTLRALAVGKLVGTIANWHNLPIDNMEAHVHAMARLFRVENEAGLRSVACALFGTTHSPSNSEDGEA